LWIVDCGLWFVVCGLWFKVCGLWFVDCGLWLVVCGLWFVVCGSWFVVCGLWIVDCGLWFVVCGLWIQASTKHQTLTSRLAADQRPSLDLVDHSITSRIQFGTSCHATLLKKSYHVYHVLGLVRRLYWQMLHGQ